MLPGKSEPSINIPIEEICQVTELERRTVYNMIQRKIIPAYHIGRNVRVRRAEFEAWLAAGGSQSAAA